MATRRARTRLVAPIRDQHGDTIGRVVNPVKMRRHKTRFLPELVDEALPDLTPAQAHKLATRNREPRTIRD